MENRREPISRNAEQKEKPTPPLPECPISYEEITALQHPVFCRDGGIYEKSAIEAWLTARGKSPLDHNLKLSSADIHQSHVLIDFIHCYNQLAQNYANVVKENNQLIQNQHELTEALARVSLLSRKEGAQKEQEQPQPSSNEKFSRKRVYPRSFIGKKRTRKDEERDELEVRNRCCAFWSFGV